MATGKDTKIAVAIETRNVYKELEAAVELLNKADPDRDAWPQGRQPYRRELAFNDLATASEVEWPTVNAALNTHFGSTADSRIAAIDFGYLGFWRVVAVLKKTTGVDDPFRAQAANLWMARLRGDVLTKLLELADKRTVPAPAPPVAVAPITLAKAVQTVAADTPQSAARTERADLSAPTSAPPASATRPQAAPSAVSSSIARPLPNKPRIGAFVNSQRDYSHDLYDDTSKSSGGGADTSTDSGSTEALPTSIDPARVYSPAASDRSRSTAPSVQPSAKPEATRGAAPVQPGAAARAISRSITPRATPARTTPARGTNQSAEATASGSDGGRRSSRITATNRKTSYAEITLTSDEDEEQDSDEDDDDSSFASEDDSADSADKPSSTTSLSSSDLAKKKARVLESNAPTPVRKRVKRRIPSDDEEEDLSPIDLPANKRSRVQNEFSDDSEDVGCLFGVPLGRTVAAARPATGTAALPARSGAAEISVQTVAKQLAEMFSHVQLPDLAPPRNLPTAPSQRMFNQRSYLGGKQQGAINAGTAGERIPLLDANGHTKLREGKAQYRSTIVYNSHCDHLTLQARSNTCLPRADAYGQPIAIISDEAKCFLYKEALSSSREVEEKPTKSHRGSSLFVSESTGKWYYRGLYDLAFDGTGQNAIALPYGPGASARLAKEQPRLFDCIESRVKDPKAKLNYYRQLRLWGWTIPGVPKEIKYVVKPAMATRKERKVVQPCEPITVKTMWAELDKGDIKPRIPFLVLKCIGHRQDDFDVWAAKRTIGPLRKKK